MPTLRNVKVVVVERTGARVLGPVRVKMEESARLVTLLAPYRSLDVVVETSSSWPPLHAALAAPQVHFVLAHARRLRAIAEANYKSDDIDAELLARMQLAGLIPPVYVTPATLHRCFDKLWRFSLSRPIPFRSLNPVVLPFNPLRCPVSKAVSPSNTAMPKRDDLL